MAIATQAYTTYTSIGAREDLIDVIENIAPVETWFTSNSGTARAKGRYHEWQQDTLAAAAANSVIEGDEFTATAIVPTTREGNYCQILRKSFRITDTQDVVDKAGRETETAYQTMMKLKELARDIEYALVINASSASGATGTARDLKGVLGWIATNVTTGSGTATETLDEDMVNDNLELVWAQGGFPSNILCGAFQKRTISGFSTNTRNVAASAKELTSAVDIYESDFGRIAVRLHHIINTSAASTLVVLGDMDHWKKAWLRPVKRETLARTGASTPYMIEAELTLESRAEKGHGKITGLKTA